MDDLAQYSIEQAVIGAKWFYKFITPTPISPLFLKDGLLEGYNEDVVFLLALTILFGLLDVLIAKPFIHPKGRYFFLHAVANTITVVASVPDIYRALTVHPYDAFSGPVYTMLGNSAVCALHFYHCIAFEVTKDDIFHHVLFVFGIASFGTPLKQSIGAAMAISNFFLSGLPGGLDYVMLILVYHKKMLKKTEKAYFANINVWLRAPGTVWFMCLGYLTWRENKVHYLPGWLAWTFALLHLYNGSYYNMIAVESAARFEYNLKNKRIDVHGSKTELGKAFEHELKEKKKKQEEKEKQAAKQNHQPNKNSTVIASVSGKETPPGSPAFFKPKASSPSGGGGGGKESKKKK